MQLAYNTGTRFMTGLEPLIEKISSLTAGVEGPKMWEETLQKGTLSPTGRAARDFHEGLAKGKTGIPKSPKNLAKGSVVKALKKLKGK